MRYDHLLDPISDDQPCGPDLEMEYDDDYVDYYYEAMARVPERFVNLGTGAVFDRKSIDLDMEVGEIQKLLARTIDLRLIILEAKFQALSGTVTAFSECVQAVAMLIENRMADVHPQVEEGDFTLRKNVIEELADRAAVVQALEHSPLFRDSRADTITFRAYQVATGAKSARDGEDVRDASGMIQAIKSVENADKVQEVFDALTTAADCAKKIKLTLTLADSGAFAPDLDALEEVLESMVNFLGEGRPDLLGGDAAGEAEEGEAGADGGAPAAAAGAGRTITIEVPPPGSVSTLEEARRALMAVEKYFYTREPSAPALLLVRQARQLVGKPLTAALAALMPDTSGQVKIDFSQELGFQIGFYKLETLADANEDVMAELQAEIDEAESAAADDSASSWESTTSSAYDSSWDTGEVVEAAAETDEATTDEGEASDDGWGSTPDPEAEPSPEPAPEPVSAPEPEPEAEPEPQSYVAESRQAAVELMSTVETFFRQSEPSSPVPILIFKAKTYINQDFTAIITEMYPKPDY